MEAEFNENDTTRTQLGKVIKAIQRIEDRQKRQTEFMAKVWAWTKKVISFNHAEAEKIRLEE